MASPRRPVWSGKTVFVTGHTGFKGSWLSLWLQSLGARVVGYSLPPATSPSLFQLGRVEEGMVSIMGDIRDLTALREAVQRYRPEFVFHLAAQSLVQYGYRNPVETFESNVIGTVNVLEAARSCDRLRAVLAVTTDKCYENEEWVWGYRENDRLGGRDPYSSSKACAELVVSAYRSSYFAEVGRGPFLASARGGNVIGGGDWSENRLIPDIVRAFLQDRPVAIRHPKAIRPWQHVLDLLNGYLALGEALLEEGSDYADAWNFGPDLDDARPVAWIVEQLKELWGGGAVWQLDQASHAHEATVLSLDCAKAKSKLGWRPAIRLNRALRWTVEWYQAYASGEEVRRLTEAQIARFEAELTDGATTPDPAKPA
jgi:CDP-glucose 4,6-dehydratase